MSGPISARRIATLVGDFDRSPAYLGLSDALRLLICDGRLPIAAKLPGERDLSAALEISRTTATRAYADLRERGYAATRRGAGTFTALPGSRARIADRALTPRTDPGDLIDLNCAAPPSPPGIQAAYDDAVTALPAYLGTHGYYPAGLPDLQAAIADSYAVRGLPTRPEQILVTPGALAATALVSQTITRAGDRVAVESPVYPNATRALGLRGGRLVASPVDPDGWDLDAVAATLRQAAPTAAYLVPDFQNPTGNLMTEADREQYAALLRRAHTRPVVDEAHQALALEGQSMPAPFAAFAPDAITVGSASKEFWGGLRLGWLRLPEGLVNAFLQTRLSMDLGAPVLEQLVLIRLLADRQRIGDLHLPRLREQRDALVAGLRETLPDWGFRVPGGGLALWCELPPGSAEAGTVSVEAERAGVVVAPGPVFAVEGGHRRFVRVPWTRPVDELRTAVRMLAEADVRARTAPETAARQRLTVA